MNDSPDILSNPLAGWSPGAGIDSVCSAERLRRRWSWRLSRWLHGALIGLVAAELILGFPLSPLVPERAGTEQMELAAIVDEPIRRAPLLMIPVLEDTRPTARNIANQEIALLSQAQLEVELQRELLDQAASPSPEAAAWVQRRMLEELAAAENLNALEQQERLAQLGQRLEQISTGESVAAINMRLSGLFGAATRATQPAARPVTGEFDHDSAQLHDVKRTENSSGGFDYVAVLLDSAGRTMESSLSQAEGEQLYKTFQIIKANPLLERVYRGVVVSLLDKLMKQGAPAAQSQDP